MGHKNIIEHMPLLLVCLEGLGKLAVKFPSIASTSISYLRDFLVDPSAILTKLFSYCNSTKKKVPDNKLFNLTGRADEDKFVDLSKLNKIKSKKFFFEALRNVAIINLTNSLKSAHTTDQYCVLAFIANVSSRLFTAEKQES